MTTKTLLTYQDLVEMGVGKRTSIYHLMKKTDFPKPLKYGRSNRWSKDDVLAWLEKQNPNKQAAECVA